MHVRRCEQDSEIYSLETPLTVENANEPVVVFQSVEPMIEIQPENNVENQTVVQGEAAPIIEEVQVLPLNGADNEDNRPVVPNEVASNGIDIGEEQVIEHGDDASSDGAKVIEYENEITAPDGEDVEMITVTPDLPVMVSPPERIQGEEVEKDKRLVVVLSDIVLQPGVPGKRSYTDALAEEARDRIAISHSQSQVKLRLFAKRQMYFAKRDFRRKAEDLVTRRVAEFNTLIGEAESKFAEAKIVMKRALAMTERMKNSVDGWNVSVVGQPTIAMPVISSAPPTVATVVDLTGDEAEAPERAISSPNDGAIASTSSQGMGNGTKCGRYRK